VDGLKLNSQDTFLAIQGRICLSGYGYAGLEREVGKGGNLPLDLPLAKTQAIKGPGPISSADPCNTVTSEKELPSAEPEQMDDPAVLG
jgi:hypothetical protein